jgi:hypothetical protein
MDRSERKVSAEGRTPAVSDFSALSSYDLKELRNHSQNLSYIFSMERTF